RPNQAQALLTRSPFLLGVSLYHTTSLFVNPFLSSFLQNNSAEAFHFENLRFHGFNKDTN
ncbi:MAG: hypothetical protein LBK73_12410, partial [Treponema sp.]|nr:hypothetical protein [Treponema sp.]